MIAAGRSALGVLLSILSAAPSLLAQEVPIDREPGSLRMRFDTIFSGTPHYVLTAQSGAPSIDDRYWRVVLLAPLQQRVTGDALGLVDGNVEAHLAAWVAVDLAAPTADGHIAGDVALAWMRYRRGPFALWLGRRFVSWGAPGGVHIDGVGGEVQLASGLSCDAIAGRPVTPTYGALLGPQPGFEGETFAAGARVGWSQPGVYSTSVSMFEHWADGIPVRRVVEMSAVATPLRWMDLRGSISWDLLGFGVMQADADASAWVARKLEFDIGYGHMNPALLIPRWSILSVFITRTFDEARARAAWHITRNVEVGGEAAAQHYSLPDPAPVQAEPQWGSRFEVFARANTADHRITVVASASHRDDGSLRMTLLRIAGSMRVVQLLSVALEGATAVDNDDFTAPRTSFYGRASVNTPFATAYSLGASLDAVRSPIAASEVRAMVHFTATATVRQAVR
jgi:hypothetical protein